MEETKIQQLRAFRTIIAQKKERVTHSNAFVNQNGLFQIEGIKILNQTTKLELKNDDEARRFKRNQFLHLFKQPRLSLKNDFEKLKNNTNFVRRNQTQQKASVLNVEFSADQVIQRKKIIDKNSIRRPQRISQQKRDADVNERSRFYTVQFIAKSEGKYETQQFIGMNILNYKNLNNTPRFSSPSKQRYQT